jgi:hypothetical protein
MKVLIWIAPVLIVLVFVFSHGEKRWSENTAGRLSLVLFAVLAVIAIAKGCG